MKTEDTEVLGRELNQARSKPDTVDRPARTARIFVHYYNSTQYCKTETVFFYIPLPPDRHHISIALLYLLIRCNVGLCYIFIITSYVCSQLVVHCISKCVHFVGDGDDTRGFGPPWVGTESAYFLAVNRNKKVTITHMLLLFLEQVFEKVFGLAAKVTVMSWPTGKHLHVTGYCEISSEM